MSAALMKKTQVFTDEYFATTLSSPKASLSLSAPRILVITPEVTVGRGAMESPIMADTARNTE